MSDPDATNLQPRLAEVPPPPAGTVPDPYATRIQPPARPAAPVEATRVQPPARPATPVDPTRVQPGTPAQHGGPARPPVSAQASGHVPATGEVLGGFVLRESLGHGGFAHVYRAESPSDGVVALKVLTNSQAGSRERFVTEANLLEQLGGRGFPRFVRAGLDDPTPWFAMELVPGRTLSQVVHEHGPLPRQDLLRVADDVASALAVLQEEHYLHRDVKPANIIVSEGRCVLIDLGIAKGHGSQTSTHAAGTIAYMAPELFQRKPHARSDVYSLGLLLIFCATGTLPNDLNFAGRDLTPQDVGPVDPVILPLVLAMTRNDPADRPPLHNIARAVVSLSAQQAPEPGLLHPREATRTERDVVTEIVTAGSLGAAAGVAGAAAAQAPATQVMPPAAESTQVMPAAGSAQHSGPVGSRTEVFTPAPQQPAQQYSGQPYPGQQYPQPQQSQYPGQQQGYPGQAQYPGQQGYPGQQQYPGQAPGHGQEQGYGRQQGYGRPDSPQPQPQPQPPLRDRRNQDQRDDDAGWRAMSMVLGIIPALLLGIAVYQVIRLIPGFHVMPDLSELPLFLGLGTWLAGILNLPVEWIPTMANLAIPLLGMVVVGLLNAITQIAGKSGARRRHMWPYVLTIIVWIVVLAVQGVVSWATGAWEDARQGITNGINDEIQKQQDNARDQVEDAIEDQQKNLEKGAEEVLEEQQDQLEENAKNAGEDLLGEVFP